jgi:Uma2 family endonuclease
MTPYLQNSIRQTVPPLESGDRLTRPEFERRYEAAPHIKKAELIEGIVYVASPLRSVPHAETHSRLVTWVGTYTAFTPGTLSGVEPTVRLDFDNEPQPDIVLIRQESVGGSARLTKDGYLEGTPELFIEIAASSAAIDTGNKKQVYRRTGVLEYVILQSYENQLEWSVLVDGNYIPLEPDADGVIRSRVFPGLWLAVDDLLANRMPDVLQTLQQGLDSQEHQEFLQKLTQGSTSTMDSLRAEKSGSNKQFDENLQ